MTTPADEGSEAGKRDAGSLTRTPKPTLEELQEWLDEGGCEATDGCWVEPDGDCEHGCPSWLKKLGLI